MLRKIEIVIDILVAGLVRNVTEWAGFVPVVEWATCMWGGGQYEL